MLSLQWVPTSVRTRQRRLLAVRKPAFHQAMTDNRSSPGGPRAISQSTITGQPLRPVTIDLPVTGGTRGGPRMTHRRLSRKGFLARSAQVLGGALATTGLLGRVDFERFARPQVGEVSGHIAANAGPGLAKLRAAYESSDIDELISLLHPKVEWRGIKPSLPWKRAPA
jgi:hypothetical protein